MLIVKNFKEYTFPEFASMHTKKLPETDTRKENCPKNNEFHSLPRFRAMVSCPLKQICEMFLLYKLYLKTQ